MGLTPRVQPLPWRVEETQLGSLRTTLDLPGSEFTKGGPSHSLASLSNKEWNANSPSDPFFKTYIWVKRSSKENLGSMGLKINKRYLLTLKQIFFHSFTQHLLLSVRHCSRHWGYTKDRLKQHFFPDTILQRLFPPLPHTDPHPLPAAGARKSQRPTLWNSLVSNMDQDRSRVQHTPRSQNLNRTFRPRSWDVAGEGV